MKIITNLNCAKDLAIGEHFLCGEYQGEFIEWRKIDEHLAISEKILDCIVFNDNKSNNKYTESIMRKWCNNVLGKSLELAEDVIYTLTEEDYQHYFPTDESRQCKATEWAIMHGIHVDENGNGSYWTASPSSVWFSYVRLVNVLGSFRDGFTDNSYIGVRPVLKI